MRVLFFICIGAFLGSSMAEAEEIRMTTLPYSKNVADGGVKCRSALKVEFSCIGNLSKGGICPLKIDGHSYEARLSVSLNPKRVVVGGDSTYSYSTNGIECAVKVPSLVMGYRCRPGKESLDCDICVRILILGELCASVHASLRRLRDQ